MDILDSVGLNPKGFTDEVKTNFRNSMNVSGLHSDSKSGTLHLHIDCCRVDLEGKTNDAHDIHERAMKAAEIINMRRGWKQPQVIRDMRKEELADFCDHTLRKMQDFDIQSFFRLLPQPTQVKIKHSSPLVTPEIRSARPMVQTPVKAKPIAQPKPTNTVFSLNTTQGIKEAAISVTMHSGSFGSSLFLVSSFSA